MSAETPIGVAPSYHAEIRSGCAGANESFNGKLRDECLGMQRFKNRIDARIVIEARRRDYNESWPHQALGQQTPFEYVMMMKDLDRSMGIETAGN